MAMHSVANGGTGLRGIVVEVRLRLWRRRFERLGRPRRQPVLETPPAGLGSPQAGRFFRATAWARMVGG